MHYEVALSWPLFQCDMESRALHSPYLLSEHTNNNLSSHFWDVCNREDIIVCFVLSWNNMKTDVYIPNISLCTNGKISFHQWPVRCSSFVVLDSFGLRKSHVHVHLHVWVIDILYVDVNHSVLCLLCTHCITHTYFLYWHLMASRHADKLLVVTQYFADYTFGQTQASCLQSFC